MAKPSGSMNKIRTQDGTDHEIIPDKVGSGNYYANLDTLTADGKILSVTPVTDNTFRIYGQSVGFYRLTQVTTIYTHATSTSSPYIVTGRSGDIIHIVRIESNITYWVMYGGLEITALLGGTVSSSSSDMYTPIADISTIKGSYIKSATVSGNDLILTKQDNTTITFQGGGGGSVSIDNTSITENSSNQIQAVGVIDQKTGNANKQWTGTLAEYNALGTHDANTFYNITDDNGGNILQRDLLWEGRKTTTGDIYVSANITNYSYLVFYGINSNSELCSYVCSVWAFRNRTVSTQPYDMGNNTNDTNRYCNIYYKNDTTMTILSIGNMTLRNIEGMK